MNTIRPSSLATQSAIDLSSARSCSSPALPRSASVAALSTEVDSYQSPATVDSTEVAAKPVARKKMEYAQFMPFTRKWENEPNKLIKLIQLPLAPAYVLLDVALAPLVPVSNVYTFFYNRSVDAQNLLNGV